MLKLPHHDHPALQAMYLLPHKVQRLLHQVDVQEYSLLQKLALPGLTFLELLHHDQPVLQVWHHLVFRNISLFYSRLSLASLCCNSLIMIILLYRPCTFSPTKSTSSSIRLVCRNIHPLNNRLSLLSLCRNSSIITTLYCRSSTITTIKTTSFLDQAGVQDYVPLIVL